MATVKVSALSAKTSLAGSEELLINDSGTSKKVTATNLLAGVTVADGSISTAKIADDAVTEAKLANAINTAIAANTAKTSTATHTGDVAGATALTIGNDKVITAKILDDNVTAAKLANSINTDIATGVTANTTANAALPKAGGEMTGAITTNSTFDGVDIATRDGVLTSTTATAAAALPKAGGTMTGNISHAGTFTIDVGGDLILDADGGGWLYKDGGTEIGRIFNSGSSFVMKSIVQDKDIKFQGNDGGGGINALILDMSDAGKATFNSSVVVGTNAVGTLTTDNDGSFAMSASNNFKCTPAGDFALTFTSIVAQSGNILFINSGGHTISAHTNTKVDATLLATISTAGTYLLAYFSDGTNVYMTNSAAYT